jgi:hypothetical protein
LLASLIFEPPKISGKFYWPPIASIRRFSSAVEQRFCKPKVGSSILSTGTIPCSGMAPLEAGTNVPLPRFPAMKIREEHCNLVLLAVVTLFTLAIAGGATLLEPVSAADKNPVYVAGRTVGSAAAASGTVNPTGQTPVRVVGAPFVPNINPRER